MTAAEPERAVGYCRHCGELKRGTLIYCVKETKGRTLESMG